MTFSERLRVHRGGLVRLRANLWWFDAGMEKWGSNRMTEAVCIILDAVEAGEGCGIHVEACGGGTAKGGDTDCIAEVYAEVLLFIDGAPRWIRLDENDLEFL